MQSGSFARCESPHTVGAVHPRPSFRNALCAGHGMRVRPALASMIQDTIPILLSSTNSASTVYSPRPSADNAVEGHDLSPGTSRCLKSTTGVRKYQYEYSTSTCRTFIERPVI